MQDEFLVPDECLPASDCNDRVAPVDNVQQCNHLDQTADSGRQGGSRNTPLGEWPDTEDQKVVTDCIQRKGYECDLQGNFCFSDDPQRSCHDLAER